VSAGGCYDWNKRLSARQAAFARPDPQLHEASRGTPGAGRMHEGLADAGETASLNRDQQVRNTAVTKVLCPPWRHLTA